MIKILVLNSPTEIGVEISSWFKDLDIQVTYKVLEPSPLPKLKATGTFFNGNIRYTVDVIDDVRSFIEPMQYNYVLYLYNASDYPQSWTTGGYTEPRQIFPGTGLATIRRDGNEADYAIHELHHLFSGRLSFLGYPCNDQMDRTLVKGIYMDYWKNWGLSRLDKDSNHALTWHAIYPYREHLGEFPPTMKREMKNPWVSAWQSILNEKGYFYAGITSYFGPLTEKATIAFQKKHGLVTDGIVGPKTMKAICLKKN
jgi:hypothetical protein